MQERQETAGQALLSAQQVQDLLHVDRSTVYRMAEDGRLPAIKVGRQWRFPAARIDALLSGTDEQADPLGRPTVSRPRREGTLTSHRVRRHRILPWPAPSSRSPPTCSA